MFLSSAHASLPHGKGYAPLDPGVIQICEISTKCIHLYYMIATEQKIYACLTPLHFKYIFLIFGTAKYDFDASSVKFQPNVYNMMTL